MNKSKLTQTQFEDAVRWIIATRAHVTVEARVFDTWGAGSRTAIFSAIKQPSFSDCSLVEKVIVFEALEMMREVECVPVGATEAIEA